VPSARYRAFLPGRLNGTDGGGKRLPDAQGVFSYIFFSHKLDPGAFMNKGMDALSKSGWNRTRKELKN
jgi:hypothetical protein